MRSGTSPYCAASTDAQHACRTVWRMTYLNHVAPLLALVACSGDPAATAPDATADTTAPSPDEVATASGPVIGHVQGAATAFLGIPYAEPPVGELRWRAPRPLAAWTEVREAAALGPACEQTDGGLGQTGPYSEDCLTLNVWAPRPAPTHAPVMVFIHGGAFVHGSSNQAGYDGGALAAAGVVVVSMNYRLGVFGFLAHPALTAEDEHGSSGNLGLL